MIPYGKQNISKEDLDQIKEVLNSDFLTQGPKITEFEEAICSSTNANHATAVSSATAALHIACLSMGLGDGDILWTSPNSFVASSNCALYCGAEVDFVDIDIETNNISIEKLEKKLRQAKETNTLPKILIPVHMCGFSCDMASIHELSKEYGFKIIEDASHCIGAKYQDNPVGSCQFSDIAVFSFHPVKIITTGEGGVATTNCEELDRMMKIYRTHGITRNAELMEGKKEGDWFYEQVSLGFNYRITDIQASLGISQLTRLEKYVKKRNELAEIYDKSLSDLPITLPPRSDSVFSSFHLYIIKINDLKKFSRKDFFDYLRSNNIGANVHYIPIHLHPFYKSKGFNPGDFPSSEESYEKSVSIPIYQDLSKKDQDYIIEKIRNYFLN